MTKKIIVRVKGGAGSGNYGHTGRPGLVGGSGGSLGGVGVGVGGMDNAMGGIKKLLGGEDWNVPHEQRTKDSITVGIAAEDDAGLESVIEDLEDDVFDVCDKHNIDMQTFVESSGGGEAEVLFELSTRK